MNANHLIVIPGCDERLPGALQAALPGWTVLTGIDALKQADPTAAAFAFVPWLLPEMAGIEACRRLRAIEREGALHVTMVLEGGAPALRQRALEAGADDYMCGPLSIEALLDRIDGASPRQAQPVPNGMRYRGELLVDPAGFHVRHNSRNVPLSRGEFAMLLHFMERPNRVLTREALAALTGKQGMISARTIDRSVARLRRTLEENDIPAPIRTVYGMGYVFDAFD